jgi:hypothetical protein
MASFIDLDSVYRDRIQYPNPCSYKLTPKQVDTWFVSAKTVRALPQNINTRPLGFACSVNMPILTLPYPRAELFAHPATCFIVDSIMLNTLESPGHTFVNNDVLEASFSTNGIQLSTQYHVINAVVGVSYQVSLTQGGAAVALVNGTGLGLMMCLVITAAGNDVVAQKLATALSLVHFPRLYVDLHSNEYPDIHMINTIDGIHKDARFIAVMEKIQYGDHGQPLWIHYKSAMEQVMRFMRKDTITFVITTRGGIILDFFSDLDIEQLADPNKQCLATFVVTPYIRDGDYSNHAVVPKPAA